MKRQFGFLAVGALVIATAACNDGGSISDARFFGSSVLASFDFTPAGFSSTENSFMGQDSAWGAHGEDHHGGPGRGHGGPGEHGFGPGGFGIGGLMGGGLGDLFRGAGFGPGFGHGHDDHCESGTHNGLTITCTSTVSADSNTINTKITVTGTFTRHDSSTTTVNNASDRTVTGLAAGSTKRTINSTATGNESTVGKDTAGTFTVKRVVGDTVKAVVIPVRTATDTIPPYPTAGSVIRASSVTVTRASGTTSSSRREVVTYDGSNTAKVTITQDGTTKTCTVALPHGQLQCN